MNDQNLPQPGALAQAIVMNDSNLPQPGALAQAML